MALGSTREPLSTVVGQYGVPVRGTWNSLAVHAVPTDALYDSMNVYLRKGWLRTRPGLTMFDDTLFDGPILGGDMVVTPLDKRLLAITKDNVYERGEFDTAWQNTATIACALDNFSPIDTAFLETSTYVGIIAQEKFPLKGWNGLLHTTLPITRGVGSDPIPLAKSVCIAGSRVVCLIPPHTIVWSKILDINNFSPLAYNKRAQSNDNGVCVRTLSNLSFVLYKERSIHTARSGGNTDSNAFVFGEPLYVEGPAGLHAVVRITGSSRYSGHMYMTRNGRVGLFDGSHYPEWIADGLWLYLQEDIDPAYSHMIFGVYDYRLHMAKFFYARKGDSGGMRGMVMICLPYEGTDIAVQPIPASFKGVSSKPCSFGMEMRFNSSIDRSMLFTSDNDNCQSFIFDDLSNLDDGVPYQCMVQTPMQAMPDAKHHDVTVQTFMQRGTGYGSVLIEPITSDALEEEQGSMRFTGTRYIDLETNPVQEHIAFNVMTRFLGLRYTWDSTNTVRYAGAMVHGRGVM